MSLFTVHFSETITLGSLIVGILLAIPALWVYGKGIRYKTAYDVSEDTNKTLAEGREAFKMRAERLEGELAAVRQERDTLNATRSLEPVLQAVLDGFGNMESRFTEHELRAQERHEINQKQGKEHLKILAMIADRLGPDNGT